jgi:hypothetical protein
LAEGEAAAGAAVAIDMACVAAVAKAPPGSNWQALKQQLAEQAASAPKRRRRQPQDGSGSTGKDKEAAAAAKGIASIGTNTALTNVLAVDCEFVGVGPGGSMDALARVSVVGVCRWLSPICTRWARLPAGAAACTTSEQEEC